MNISLIGFDKDIILHRRENYLLLGIGVHILKEDG
jgi:hypothetical protein